MCSSHFVASKASAVSAVTTTCAHWVPSFRAGIRVHLMTLQRVSQNCLRSSAAHSGCIPPTKYAFLFMPGAPSSLPSGLFGCCSGADSFNSNFFRLRLEVSTHSLFSTDLFDFIKSCGCRIDLKFSGVALLGLLYSPKWKRSFLSKGKVPFSLAGSLLRAVQESFSVEEIYRWKEDRFVFFMKKTIGPRILSFSRKNQTKMVRKTEDDVP